ncbi:MAG: 23S rRNA (pseudouridine(1915)-N(3))-methyltransferase RlmH [Raoultibacter sp.]
MPKISVIAVGKLKERFWKEACEEYLKRLQAYAKVLVREVPDSTPAKEEAAILAALPGDAQLILLDINGTETSSLGLSAQLDALALGGTSHIAFIIGGSDGVSAAVKAAAHQRLSFGPITLPHNLARVVLLEQIYRAYKISHGEPYHK